MRSAIEMRKPGIPGALWHPATFWKAPVPLGDVANNPTGGDAVEAHISAGRWVVECPDCHSALLASLDDLRFMCAECANVCNDHLFRPVILPAELANIEAALHSRPTRNQNWRPGETVAFLHQENVDHMGAR